MLTYTLSRREKVLVLILAIIMVAVAWFILVYQSTTDQITKLDGELSTAEAQITLDSTRVADLANMKQVIEERKAEGARAVEMPTYDNIKPLMAELNVIMRAADSYTLTFDELDTESGTYVARGVVIDYGVQSFGDAENVMKALAGGSFPCSIDTIAIADSTTGQASRTGRGGSGSPVTVSLHVTFFESVK